MTISRYVVLSVIAITAAFPSAAAAAPSTVLHEGTARRVMALYLSEQQERDHDAGWEINDCRRYSRATIWCHVVEVGVEWDGVTGDLYYRLRAKRVDDAVRLLSSPWDDLHFEMPIYAASRAT